LSGFLLLFGLIIGINYKNYHLDYNKWGVGDHKPTQTGKVIVGFLNGRMPAYVNTGLNLVDVEDVVIGHMLAAEKGKIGERYFLGGENLTLLHFIMPFPLFALNTENCWPCKAIYDIVL